MLKQVWDAEDYPFTAHTPLPFGCPVVQMNDLVPWNWVGQIMIESDISDQAPMDWISLIAFDKLINLNSR